MVVNSVSVRSAAMLGLLACSILASANPTGPEVVQGTASFNSVGGTLTVTPSSNAIIQWRAFNVAPGETVRFVQPSAGSSVINRISGGNYSVAGTIESNGKVLFLNDTTISGPGGALDLAGVVDSSGRLRPIPASRRPAPRDDGPQRAVTLAGDRVFVIGADSLRRGAGRTLLVPGRGAELGDVRIPYVRVYVAAPANAPVDLDSLVTRRPALGMFNALFSPAPAARSETGATAIAAALAPPAQVEERTVLAFNAPVEDRAVMVFSAPVVERSLLATALVPARVEERAVIAFSAPIEDRAVMLFSAPVVERSLLATALVPARVEDRVVLAFNAPVEDRAVEELARMPAPVEDRPVLAFNAPIEERVLSALPVVPAPVVERRVLAFRSPVEEREVAVFSAPVDERAVAVVWIAPAEEREIVTRSRVVQAEQRVSLVALARPAQAASESLPEAAPIRVASAPSMILPPSATVSTTGGAAVVRLPSVQRRLPRIMVDHRGAIFHL